MPIKFFDGNMKNHLCVRSKLPFPSSFPFWSSSFLRRATIYPSIHPSIHRTNDRSIDRLNTRKAGTRMVLAWRYSFTALRLQASRHPKVLATLLLLLSSVDLLHPCRLPSVGPPVRTRRNDMSRGRKYMSIWSRPSPPGLLRRWSARTSIL